MVGRAIALNSVSIFAGMAGEKPFWGFVASRWDVQTAFIASGVAMVASLLAIPFPLRAEEPPDLTPTHLRPIDELHGPVGPDDGPIVVGVEYRVKPKNSAAFLAAMDDLGRIRRRNGAHRWTLHQDIDDRTRWVERFHSMTWLDHLRRQTRTTKADQLVRERVGLLHEGELIVQRLIERRISTAPLPVPSVADARIDVSGSASPARDRS